ncbi:MAG TPA: ATP-binding cassette domain-containing protein [Chitinophagaceae bacterium]|nr:ATP-binding cassette domain-containing protein [Chitinophagaceae bacterium]
MSILSLQNITKYYGSIRALNNVSMEVPKGSVFGILGPNGSGKTTMLGIVMDVLKATHGTYRWFGEEPTAQHRRRIGTLLETPNFYHYLSGERNLRINAEIKGHGLEDIPHVLQRVNLWERKNSKFSSYSLGMKQRLAVANCLLGSPDVLVFDEPTNGLDPVGIADTRELIKNLAKEGITIILASHLLDEVEKVCSHVAILQKGNLLASGHVDEVLLNEDIVEVSAADLAQLEAALKTTNGWTHMKQEGDLLQVFYPQGSVKMENINRHCFDKGVVLNHLQLKRKSLETKFFELTNADVNPNKKN